MQLIERILWNSRWGMLVPVIASMLLALALILVTTADALALVGEIVRYLTATDAVRDTLYTTIVSGVVAIVDGFLLTAVLIIFSLGIYELFIGRIDAAENSEVGARLLLIKSLDDLKDRLANVILIILIVKFFQQALSVKYASVSDIFLLAVAVALIALALFLSGRAKSAKSEAEPKKE